MAFYNLMRREDRDRLRADRVAEIAAIDSGEWPRSVDDSLRWGSSRYFVDGAERAEYARAMCVAEVEYLDALQKRVEAGDKDVIWWEA